MYNDKQTAYAENMTPPPYNVQESQTPLSSNPVYPEPATSPSAGATSSGFDDYETNKSYDNFSEIRVRHRFIMKVYSIVSLQLLITTAFIALFRFYPPLGAYCAQYSGMWILYVSMVGVFVLIFILSCVESVRRHYPSNLILLFVFTGFESVLIGFITTAYSTNVLLKGIGLTGIIVVGLTIFAFQTKYDFTGFGKLDCFKLQYSLTKKTLEIMMIIILFQFEKVCICSSF